MSDYRVNLDIFAGPMDLLLYLIRKDEVDVYDIPIAEITNQYVHYIDMLKNFDIDLAGDFLVMAATLMHIKSVMLLPMADAEDGGEDGELIDPRSELIQQLLEYKKFKDAANLLESAAHSKGERFGRPATIVDNLKGESEPELDIDQVNVWDLLEAFDRVMKATGSYLDISLIKDDTPTDLYQIDILNNLQLHGPMSFGSIFEGVRSKIRMVGLFLALLELSRGELIWIDVDESSKTFFIKALTDEPAEKAVQRAIITMEEDELLRMQEQMEKQNLGERVAEGEFGDDGESQQENGEDEELLVEMDVEEFAETVNGAGIPIVELPAEKVKKPIVVENADVRGISQAGFIPIVELPADSDTVEKQHQDNEGKLAEDYSD